MYWSQKRHEALESTIQAKAEMQNGAVDQLFNPFQAIAIKSLSEILGGYAEVEFIHTKG